jgi:hypothetical protein
MSGIDLQNRLRCIGQSAGACQQFLKLAIGASLLSDQADRAVGQAF